MKKFRPILAAEADLTKLRFPLLASPKFDGIRCLIHNGTAVSRSLKPIPNNFIRNTLSLFSLEGLDGELIVGSPTAKNAFNRTTSAVARKEGEPDFKFYVFDQTKMVAPFHKRIASVAYQLTHIAPEHGRPYLEYVTQQKIVNHEDLQAYEDHVLDLGYEGLILRDPEGPYKYGRSTANEQYALKLKRFVDAEAEILEVIEGMTNLNTPTTNALGLTERSTAKAGKTPNGTCGALKVRDLETGVEFEIGTGLNTETANYFWHHRHLVKGWIVKYKHFPTGAMEKPRFPVFLGLRMKEDM